MLQTQVTLSRLCATTLHQNSDFPKVDQMSAIWMAIAHVQPHLPHKRHIIFNICGEQNLWFMIPHSLLLRITSLEQIYSLSEKFDSLELAIEQIVNSY